MDFLPLLEEFWEILLPVPKGPGRRAKTRLGQFLFFIYLLYFTSEPLTRAMNTVNTSHVLRQIFCLGNEELTSQSFGRFVDWLEEGRIDRIHVLVVRHGIKHHALTLEHLVTDSGPVNANVNTKKALIFPKTFRRALFYLFKRMDFSSLGPFEKKFGGTKYPLVYKVKLYLIQILCGLGALTQLYRFIEKYPEILKLLEECNEMPSYQTMANFIQDLRENQSLDEVVQGLLTPLIAVLTDLVPENLPHRVDRTEDLYGTLGTKHARVDRGARIGSKGKKNTNWYGYKDHVTVDQGSGLPVMISTTGANAPDSSQLPIHVQLIQEHYGDLIDVNTWTGDKGYDSDSHRELLVTEFGAKPQLCKREPSEKEKKRQKAWNSLRQVVEHVISRGQLFSRKRNPRIRGRWRVDVWVKMSYFIVLAVGLSLFFAGEPDMIRKISFYLN